MGPSPPSASLFAELHKKPTAAEFVKVRVNGMIIEALPRSMMLPAAAASINWLLFVLTMLCFLAPSSCGSRPLSSGGVSGAGGSISVHHDLPPLKSNPL